MTDTRFVQCPDCDGSGEVQVGTAHIYERGCGYSHIDAVMERCDTCHGTGEAEQEVWRVMSKPTKPRFSLEDADRAHEAWGANCGPGALAAMFLADAARWRGMTK